MKYLFVICSLPTENDCIDLRLKIEFALNRVHDRFHESRNGTGCLVMQLVLDSDDNSAHCKDILSSLQDAIKGRPWTDISKQLLEQHLENK